MKLDKDSVSYEIVQDTLIFSLTARGNTHYFSFYCNYFENECTMYMLIISEYSQNNYHGN